MEELTTTGTEPAELDTTTSNPLILEDPLDSSNPSTELGNTTSETGTVEEIPFQEALDQSADPNADIEESFLIAINNTTGEITTIDALTGEVVRTSIDTSDNKGFIIQGVSDDNLGYSVSSAGDINGDGIGDIVIGSPLSDPNNQSNAGKTYVVFGKTDSFNQTIDISSLNGTNGFVINGAKAGDESGRSVSNIGDINGDGVDDLAIGAPGGIGNAAGSAYIIFGSKESDYFNNPIELSNLDGKGFEIQGSELFTNRNAGWAISAAGDINGDGIKDLLIGASNPGNNESGTIGETYVIFGKENFDSTLNLDEQKFGFDDGLIIYSYNKDNLNDDKNSLGYSVSDAGDINGDGIDDLIIGAPYADPNGNNSGSSYVIYGRSEDNPFTDDINIFNLNSSDGFVINGQNGDKSGFSVSKAGDINGDRIGDLIIGAKDGNPDDKESAGRSYVVFGSEDSEDFDSSINLSDLDGSNGFAINGISAGDNSGWSVGALGDINGDGIDDIIVGANNANSTAGQSYVIYGNDTGFDSTFELSSLESPDSQNGFIIDGAFIGDNLGHSVRGAGDVNGDGVNDLIIGAPFANSKAGAAYVLFSPSLDGTDTGTDDGTDTGTDDGTDTGTDDGTDTGTNDVTDTGTNDVTVNDSLSLVSDDVFNIKGNDGKVTLEIKLTGLNSNGVNELGVFTVDDASGTIDGIAPGESGYAEKALAKGQVIFSTITNFPAGFDAGSIEKLIEFESNDNLRFYLVKDGSTDSVLNNNTPISNVLFADPSAVRITDLGANSFSLNWEDGSDNPSGFEDLQIQVQVTDQAIPLGTAGQNKPQGESLDLRSIAGSVNANFVVNREASYNNFVGFYRVTDANGGIDTNGDGTADILPGQDGYVQAALNGRVSDISLNTNNGGTAELNTTLQGGAIYVPFLVADGGFDANNPNIYFAFLGANSDGVDHVRMLGDNTFGFEDLRGGGDKDFNDMIVKVNLTQVV
ncbi:MAG: DUF4114 domain-containing protein [Nostocales cyanobacterium ELA608]